MTLAKTDLRIARGYVDALADPKLRPIFEQICAEHELTLEQVQLLTDGSGLLSNYPLLQYRLTEIPAEPSEAVGLLPQPRRQAHQ